MTSSNELPRIRTLDPKLHGDRANGLPREGHSTEIPYVGDLAHDDAPTCELLGVFSRAEAEAALEQSSAPALAGE